jgi:hypothetical protein
MSGVKNKLSTVLFTRVQVNFLWIIVIDCIAFVSEVLTCFRRCPEKKLYFMWFVQYILCHVLVSKLLLYYFFVTVVVVDGDRKKYSCIVMLIPCNIFMFQVWKNVNSLEKPNTNSDSQLTWGSRKINSNFSWYNPIYFTELPYGSDVGK